jgi:hypothetical protein
VIPFTIIVTAAYYTFHSLKTLALPGYSSLQPIYLLYINSFLVFRKGRTVML